MRRAGLYTSLTALLIFFFNFSDQAQTHWVASWTASQQLAEPQNSLATDDLRDATLRQIVHLSLGGTQLRVRISNRFGTAPLHFSAVHVARPVSTASAKIVEGTDKALSFSGKPDVIVPAGADYLSDPVDFPAAPLSDLAISFYLERASTAADRTSRLARHFLSRAWRSSRGLDFPNAKKVEHWYLIAEWMSSPRRSGGDCRAGRFDHRRTWRDDQWQRSVARCAGGAAAGVRDRRAV